jgi:hypothetical protein
MFIMMPVGGLVVGLITGHAIRVFLIAPISMIVAVFALVVGLQKSHGISLAVLEAVVTVVLLQLGYFVGLALRHQPSWWCGLGLRSAGSSPRPSWASRRR